VSCALKASCVSGVLMWPAFEVCHGPLRTCKHGLRVAIDNVTSPTSKRIIPGAKNRRERVKVRATCLETRFKSNSCDREYYGATKIATPQGTFAGSLSKCAARRFRGRIGPSRVGTLAAAGVAQGGRRSRGDRLLTWTAVTGDRAQRTRARGPHSIVSDSRQKIRTKSILAHLMVGSIDFVSHGLRYHRQHCRSRLAEAGKSCQGERC
jgi:hypothetical protein